MPPGRTPTPTAIKILHGNPGHRKLNDKEPQPELLIPECPDHLDETAQREWNRLTPILLRIRVLTEADYIALGTLCVAYSRLIQAQKELNKSGLLVKSGTSGYVQQSPLIGIITTCTKDVLALSKEFGLTPGARVRLVAETGQPAETGSTLIR